MGDASGEPPPPAPRRVLRPQAQGSFRAVLTNYAFLRLWIAQAVSQTANSMVDFSLLLSVGEVVEYHKIAQANTAVSFDRCVDYSWHIGVGSNQGIAPIPVRNRSGFQWLRPFVRMQASI